MKRIKILALTLCFIIGGLLTFGFVHSAHQINYKQAAAPIAAFVPLALVKKLKEKGVYEKLDADTKAFMDTLDEELNTALKSIKQGDFLDETGVKKLLEGVKGLPDDVNGTDISKMKTDLEETIKGFDDFQKAYTKKKDVGTTRKSLYDAMAEAFEEKKDEIAAILKSGGKQSGPLILELKGFSMKDTPVTIMDSNTILASGSASHYSLTSDTGIISAIRKRLLTYLQNVAVGRLDVEKPYAMWIEELDEQGNPIFLAEGDTKPQASVRYEEREKRSKKIAVYGKVTIEFLRYLSKLVSYVQNNLMKRMDIVTENQLFNGDDTGNNLKGILSYASQFDGGKGVANVAGLVGLVHNPSYADVFRAIALQVYNSYGTPTAIWVDPSILALMDTEKSKTSGVYLMPPFRTPGGDIVAGLRLIGTTALIGTGFDFIGGDTSVINVEFLMNATVQIGLDGNDFTQNKKTILMEQELVQFVSANDTKVLVKGTFAAAKALINSGS